MGEKQDSGCTCSVMMAKTWLIVFNTIFVLLGLALAVVGGLTKFNKDLVSHYLDDMLQQVDTADGESIADALDAVAIGLLVAGVVILGFGLIGCFGGCCMIRCCLLVYSLIMIKLLVAEVIIIIVWFAMQSVIEDTVKSALLAAIRSYYTGDTGTDAVTLGMNWLFVELDCCGVDNYTEMYIASNWNRTYVASDNSTYALATPIMCCKLDGSFPEVTLPSNPDCAVTPNATTSNYDSGCYDAFFVYVEPYHIALLVIGSSIILCELLSSIAAFILNDNAKHQDNKVDDVPRTPVKNVKQAQLKQKSLAKNNMNF